MEVEEPTHHVDPPEPPLLGPVWEAVVEGLHGDGQAQARQLAGGGA